MVGSTPAKLAKFGCSNFEYGVVGDGDLVQTTRKVPGLSEVKIELTDEMKTLAADDGPYLVLSGGITETKETINIYDLDSETKKDLYGITVEKGVEKYAKNIMPNYVATLFKTKLSNGKNVWFALLKGMFSLPGLVQDTRWNARPGSRRNRRLLCPAWGCRYREHSVDWSGRQYGL